ncbi:hypothetical protein V6N11_007439 [Hibiscus sabdariffa]|uniref:RNase H type-1 domain-containing protein n=2 Tax=Hibiscus sabdariffa TaxID=183260 RepID=A0ABR2CBN5_9ROSI
MVTNTIDSSVLTRASSVTGARLVADSERWVPPEIDWIKVNIDGARKPVNGYAMCGGVGRNSAADWLFEFSQFIGICSIVDAELWRVYYGLRFA